MRSIYIALARLGTMLSVIREITRINIHKPFNFRIKSEMCKGQLLYNIVTTEIIMHDKSIHLKGHYLPKS